LRHYDEFLGLATLTFRKRAEDDSKIDLTKTQKDREKEDETMQ
jgi:hypothetical protein